MRALAILALVCSCSRRGPAPEPRTIDYADWGEAPPPDATPPPPPPDAHPDPTSCEAVASRMSEAPRLQEWQYGDDDEAVEAARAHGERAKPGLIQACVDDGWSIEHRGCVARVPPLDALRYCAQHLTPAQQEAMDAVWARTEEP